MIIFIFHEGNSFCKRWTHRNNRIPKSANWGVLHIGIAFASCQLEAVHATALVRFDCVENQIRFNQRHELNRLERVNMYKWIIYIFSIEPYQVHFTIAVIILNQMIVANHEWNTLLRMCSSNMALSGLGRRRSRDCSGIGSKTSTCSCIISSIILFLI